MSTNSTTLTFDQILALPKNKQPAVDFDQSARRSRLNGAISKRVSEPSCRETVSGLMVLEQASDRYFQLISEAQQSLRDRFTDAEWDIMLNVECGPIWGWDTQLTVATMVADDHSVDALSDLDPNSHLRLLLGKLLELSPLENAALVDACEQVWRGHENPLRET